MSIQELRNHASVHWSSSRQQEVSEPHRARVDTRGFQKTRWGWFPWAPTPWESLVHPEDLAIAGDLIPSPRILTSNPDPADPQYSIFSYGHLHFRLLPCLWREVHRPTYDLGQAVEISSLYSHHEPTMVMIEEIYWDQTCEQIRYLVSNRGHIWPNPVDDSDFVSPKPI